MLRLLGPCTRHNAVMLMLLFKQSPATYSFLERPCVGSQGTQYPLHSMRHTVEQCFEVPICTVPEVYVQQWSPTFSSQLLQLSGHAGSCNFSTLQGLFLYISVLQQEMLQNYNYHHAKIVKALRIGLCGQHTQSFSQHNLSGESQDTPSTQDHPPVLPKQVGSDNFALICIGSGLQYVAHQFFQNYNSHCGPTAYGCRPGPLMQRNKSYKPSLIPFSDRSRGLEPA